MFVAPALRGFLENNPHLTVDLSLTDDIVDLLAQRADVAIRMGTLADSGLIARKLGESPRVICAAPAYLERRGIPQLPEDLAGHDCLTFNFRRGWPTWPFRQDGRNIEQPVRGNLIVNNGETMRQMTLAGVGIARLGSFHVAADISAGRLTPLLEAYNPGDLELISALYVGGGPIPHRVRVFIEYMAKALKQLSLG